MVLKFETNLKGVGSLATENGLHVVGFYTDLVELKQEKKGGVLGFRYMFYTDLVELKHKYADRGKWAEIKFYTHLVELKVNFLM